MYLVIGLGNPQTTYGGTRHNAGVMALDAFRNQHNFPQFTESAKHKAELSEGMVDGEKVILAKPATFMNNSGEAAGRLTSFFKLSPSSVIVVHDEIDLPLGEVKVSQNSGSAGHKGVNSVIHALGTKEFHRVRIGIRPETGKPEDVEAFVLKNFSWDELPLVEKAAREAAARILSVINGG